VLTPPLPFRVMKPPTCAAVDLGATSGRVIAGIWAKNRLGLTEVHQLSNQLRPLAGRKGSSRPIFSSNPLSQTII
jgi:hypothetical protein